MFEAWQNENSAWLVRFGHFKVDVVGAKNAAIRLASALNAEPEAQELGRQLDSADWTFTGSRAWAELWGYTDEIEALCEAGKPLSPIQQAASDLSAIVARLRQ